MTVHLARLLTDAAAADHLDAALHSAAVIACGLLAAFIWRKARRGGEA